VPMLDGSKVTLNTNSQLRVALSDSVRRVELHRGEAFFEVAKDSQRPFYVEVGTKRVIAVGTRFSVRREGDDIEVVVTEGKVRVEDNAASEPLFLTPGAIARTAEAGVLVQQKSVAEAETHLSWRNGVLMFRDQDLGAAAAEFNRYNVRQIVIDDPAVAALRVEGNFKATNLDAFVRLVESGFQVRATFQDDRIILGSR
jgi:transmembrane sensor